ncbi:hypothetical protein KUCAC02_032171 [Chaenocephalus aceratus]|nr:hypothetical protein KUCAC02_032171 [Chaenocephalus aceratus]
MVSCVAASERPPRQLPACPSWLIWQRADIIRRVFVFQVQMDVFCSDSEPQKCTGRPSSRRRMLDLSLNQCRISRRKTLAYQNGFPPP